MVTSIQMAVFWIVALCNMVGIERLFSLMMEALSSSEISVNICQSTQYDIPKDRHLKIPH
jgi:hypothetical protein